MHRPFRTAGNLRRASFHWKLRSWPHPPLQSLVQTLRWPMLCFAAQNTATPVRSIRVPAEKHRMGFGQWFWRLFLVFTGLIVAHVLVVSLLAARHAESVGPAVPPVELWTTAAVAIAAGAASVSLCLLAEALLLPSKQPAVPIDMTTSPEAKSPGT